MAGKREGQGRLRWPDGAVYEGEFRQGVRSGWGSVRFANGATYEGGWLNSKTHGYGKFVWPDGVSSYEGEHRDGEGTGYGVRTYSDGIRYEGEFRNGQFSGLGIYYWPTGERREGSWLNGKKDGPARYFYAGDRRVDDELWREDQDVTPQGAQSSSSGSSGQWIAGLIGAATIAALPGSVPANVKARVATGFVADVATDGQAGGLAAARADLSNAAAAQSSVEAAQRAQQVNQQSRLVAEAKRNEMLLAKAKASATRNNNAAAPVAPNGATQPLAAASKTANGDPNFVQDFKNRAGALNVGAAPSNPAPAGLVTPATPATTSAQQAVTERNALGEPYSSKLESFVCTAPGVSAESSTGKEQISQGPCREAQLAAKRVQCRGDWIMHTATLALYQCAAANSTGRYVQYYQTQVDWVQSNIRQYGAASD